MGALDDALPLTRNPTRKNMHDTTQQLREVLENAEFLLRNLAINWKEASQMKDSCRNAAEELRVALANLDR
jgi:hypothetical protein